MKDPDPAKKGSQQKRYGMSLQVGVWLHFSTTSVVLRRHVGDISRPEFLFVLYAAYAAEALNLEIPLGRA